MVTNADVIFFVWIFIVNRKVIFSSYKKIIPEEVKVSELYSYFIFTYKLEESKLSMHAINDYIIAGLKILTYLDLILQEISTKVYCLELLPTNWPLLAIDYYEIYHLPFNSWAHLLQDLM